MLNTLRPLQIFIKPKYPVNLLLSRDMRSIEQNGLTSVSHENLEEKFYTDSWMSHHRVHHHPLPSRRFYSPFTNTGRIRRHQRLAGNISRWQDTGAHR